ncbi:NAD-dependent epimerase/dehydratase family protein [Halomarina ordinaria]|uniref:NAD-dependent epimerase/dehydratase family protein n=1 Tax=Halomarina ordinaria TaxID=3033939 RepID=A0ABD5U785_9EURY|nr:NAD-dependent epimerase/dehydratase family protein [Halomarina sp. PSRA2]
MDSVLIVGGTRFIGRHAVEEFLDHGYEVTLFTRGNRENPFADREGVEHVEGDRTNDSALELARERVDPDVVVDCVAYYPKDVRAATEIFADCDAYVYVSSGAAYGASVVPKREGETPLHDCSAEQATDDSWDSYGPRKAEGDRAVFAAAERGVRAMSVRPPVVYGPHDYTERFDYWVDRVLTHDRLVVPYTDLRHLVYVGDVASALRVVAEDGEAGAAYNVGDHTLPVLGEWVELLAAEVGTEVDVVRAGERELSAGDLEPADFPLYLDYPHVLDTHELESLGWTATPLSETVAATVEGHEDGAGREQGPDREAEERVLGVLETF